MLLETVFRSSSVAFFKNMAMKQIKLDWINDELKVGQGLFSKQNCKRVMKEATAKTPHSPFFIIYTAIFPNTFKRGPWGDLIMARSNTDVTCMFLSKGKQHGSLIKCLLRFKEASSVYLVRKNSTFKSKKSSLIHKTSPLLRLAHSLGVLSEGNVILMKWPFKVSVCPHLISYSWLAFKLLSNNFPWNSALFFGGALSELPPEEERSVLTLYGRCGETSRSWQSFNWNDRLF